MAITIIEQGLTTNTIQDAINLAAGGAGLTQNTTIVVDAGIYPEDLLIIDYSHKTNGFTLTIKNKPGELVTLDGRGVANRNIEITRVKNIVVDGINMKDCAIEDAGGANIRINGNNADFNITGNIVIKNCTVRNGYTGCRTTDMVKNVTFQNIVTSGFKYGTFRCGKQQVDLQDISFIGCTITTDGLQDSGANSFQLKGIQNLNIIRCVFDGSEKTLLSPWYCSNVVVDGCLFKRSSLLNTNGQIIYFETACNNWIIQNNIFESSLRNAPINGLASSNITFRNNIFLNPTSVPSGRASYFLYV